MVSGLGRFTSLTHKSRFADGNYLLFMEQRDMEQDKKWSKNLYVLKVKFFMIPTLTSMELNHHLQMVDSIYTLNKAWEPS